MATIKIVTGVSAGQVHELSEDQTLFGREAFCDIVLPVRSISRQHARIMRDGDVYYLEDLQSLNGTFLNGKRVDSRVRLSDSDRIHVYEVLMTFHDGLPPGSDELRAAPNAAPVPLKDPSEPRQATIVNSLDARGEPGATSTTQERLRAVLEINRNLGKSLAIEEFLPNVLDSLFDIFPQTERGYILLVEEATGNLVARAVKDRSGDTGDSATMGPISRSVAARVMTEGEAILSADSSDDDIAAARDSILDFSLRSMMTSPLIGPSRKALGIIQLDTSDQARRFDKDDLEVLISVSAVVGQAVEHARAHELSLKLDRRERELNTAKEVQLHFLPQRRPEVPGYQFYDYYRAAEDVGGDYFDYIPLPHDRLAIAVGDVSGKGVSAALLMARLCSDVRYSLVTTAGPEEAVTRLNRSLSESTLVDRFVTFLVCILDYQNHTLTVVNAGHMPPVLRRGDTRAVEQPGEVESGPPLGFDPQLTYTASTVSLEVDDTVIMYTDGISEAKNTYDHVYGIKRVSRVVAAGPRDVGSLGEALLNDVKRFAEGQPQSDDICLLAFSRSGPS